MKKLLLLLAFLSCAACLSAFEFVGFGYEYLGTIPFGFVVDELLDVRMTWHSLSMTLGYAPRSDRLTWEGSGYIQIVVNGEFLQLPSFGVGGGAFIGAALPLLAPRIASAPEGWRPGVSISAGAGGLAYLFLATFLPSMQFVVAPEATLKLILPTRGARAMGVKVLGRLALYPLDPDGFSSQFQAGVFVLFGDIPR